MMKPRKNSYQDKLLNKDLNDFIEPKQISIKDVKPYDRYPLGYVNGKKFTCSTLISNVDGEK